MNTVNFEELQNYRDELGDSDFETSFFYYQNRHPEILAKANDINLEHFGEKETSGHRPLMMHSSFAKNVLYKGATMASGLGDFFLKSVLKVVKKLPS